MSALLTPSHAQMLSKSKKKPEMSVIGGCLRGLCSYLTNFSQSVAEGTHVCACGNTCSAVVVVFGGVCGACIWLCDGCLSVCVWCMYLAV